MLRNKQIGVKALIDRGDSEFLFLRRHNLLHGETVPGWDLPGGRVDTDKKSQIRENPITALLRETHEETGFTKLGFIRVVGFQIFEIKDLWLTVERTYFMAEPPISQEVVINPKEHTDYCWATVEQALGNLPLNPMLREYLNEYSGNVSRVPARSQVLI